MTQQIGDSAEFTAFEEFTVSYSESTDEFDLVEKDTNVVLSGGGEGYEVNIAFVFVPSDFTSPVQKLQDIKNLTRNSTVNNTVDYQGHRGRVSVEEVSFPDDSEEDNLRRGSISGIFLPWPKHFPEESI